MKTEELYKYALLYTTRYVKGGTMTKTLRSFNGYETVDDIAMDVVEKILKCNPSYLTRAYVKIATKCVCINKLKKKLVNQVELNPLRDEESTPIVFEELVEGDAFDVLGDLEDFILPTLSEQERETYDALLTHKFYPQIAEDLGISTRTLERRVHDLKYKLTYILTEEEPEAS